MLLGHADTEEPHGALDRDLGFMRAGLKVLRLPGFRCAFNPKTLNP